MAFTFTRILILFVSLSSLILDTHAARAPRTIQTRLYSLCKPTTNMDLCYKTILPEVVGLSRFSNYKALEVEILATQKQVETTSKLITSLLAKPGNSKDLTESLQICKEQYGNILDSIEESKNQVAQRNVIEARFKFSAAISLQVSCNDSFTAGTSPIVKEAQDVFDLAGNCLDIMKAIEDRESRRRRGGSPVTSPSVPSPCQGQVGLCS
ncbi:hypothetical protein JHK82_042156 [Glycine max]|uniref:Pectinesterase inhibitor domain-containing protein n=2 Tax=Glycine subgen. Soja TaxID=1462606 RepID=I1MG17_SOYBN|nr:uncharacterized protein LOC100788363 [Glycine max]XP_028203756.1 uncharacterized protein LOC114387747 [Glycine soja]KAG4948963.1 hypothetical protein JHK86_042202 [Glycine max]KAG5105186.1 hypothetical protein JHK82_042156 [Glycine max]KAG5116306.1 hypothetical protein JHK84_042419 [Glycine max]KAH1146915.1 hypothetical protein GYH30_042194 [Glycine max]KRH11756.1 hypothetical protein GLYMA_15G128200v4 [Glycine max]|eukprot:XP_003547320.1 uncharacterized protein LOC100788363 [Glycine max]